MKINRNRNLIEYKFSINSIDPDNDEGAISEDVLVATHPEVLTPELTALGNVNAVDLKWTDLSPVATFYKVFRNGSYLGDFDNPSFSCLSPNLNLLFLSSGLKRLPD